MMPGMNCMPARGMGVVGGFFVVSAFMMLGGFRMVLRSEADQNARSMARVAAL